MARWADDNPYFLLILNEDESGSQRIDLGVDGWATTYSHLMRAAGTWYLCHKGSGQIQLAVTVHEGDQPYYMKRHVGKIEIGGLGRFKETAAYGIGKKLPDGTMVRLWLLPDGVAVCGGDDVEGLAMKVVEAMEWQEQPPE